MIHNDAAAATADEAVEVLVHYFRVLTDAAGLPRNPDQDLEIERALKSLVDAAVREALDRHDTREEGR